MKLDKDKVYSVKVYKMTDDVFEGLHPNGIQEGYETEGLTVLGLPQVNRSFYVSNFHTSTITEILEETETGGKFKTLNSTYSWELLPKQPTIK